MIGGGGDTHLRFMDCREVRSASVVAMAVAPSGPMLLELHIVEVNGWIDRVNESEGESMRELWRERESVKSLAPGEGESG